MWLRARLEGCAWTFHTLPNGCRLWLRSPLWTQGSCQRSSSMPGCAHPCHLINVCHSRILSVCRTACSTPALVTGTHCLQALNMYHDGSEGIQSHFDDGTRFSRPIFSVRLFSDSRLSFGTQLYGWVVYSVVHTPCMLRSILIVWKYFLSEEYFAIVGLVMCLPSATQVHKWSIHSGHAPWLYHSHGGKWLCCGGCQALRAASRSGRYAAVSSFGTAIFDIKNEHEDSGCVLQHAAQT